MNYQQFFRVATRTEHDRDGLAPMLWQCRLACGEHADLGTPKSLESGVAYRSRLIDIPTGGGKTAGLILAWLWNRMVQNDEWPRRLVYCLPMRSLVEQTRESAESWLTNLLRASPALGIAGQALADLQWLAERSPIILMGGEEDQTEKAEWDLYPERPAILIGTQDMLLSRALNRGYAIRRYRWPWHFGLLNSDCLWICDEVQLMGPGVATASQLEAFRRNRGGAKPNGVSSFFGGRSATWYASATSSLNILQTREWRDVVRPDDFFFSLTEAERADTASAIGLRRHALRRLGVHPDWHFGDDHPPDETVSEIVSCHSSMVARLRERAAPADVPRRTLIVCNTVDRAVGVFDALCRRQGAGELQHTDLVLLHSRFRPADRDAQSDRLKREHLQSYLNGQIVVSTQVIEAGVDLSSAALWSEVAPLSSLVQRLGRLNRAGEFGANGVAAYGWTPLASIVGLELPAIPASPKEAKQKAEKEARNRYLPYEQRLCEDTWRSLAQLNADASPAALDSIRDAVAASIEGCPYSLQRHELLDFFDTDSNLSLGYTDVSPFVRGVDEDTDVFVLWRRWEGHPNDHFRGDVARDELCLVPISRARKFDNWRQGWIWVREEREGEKGSEGQGGWISAQARGIFPGATLLLPISAGGYASDCGWTGNSDHKPVNLYRPPRHPSDEDALSYLHHGWRSIADHARDARGMLWQILEALPSEGFLTAIEKEHCLKAALWHDIGKNHEKWKGAACEALRAAGIASPRDPIPLAKFSLADSRSLKDEVGNPLTGDRLRREIYRLRKLFRPGMAHEVASALALRQRHIDTTGRLHSLKTSAEYLCQLLSEYLVMSHHGRVRKVLRDEVPRSLTGEKPADSVRGVTEGDRLDFIDVDGERLGCEELSVDCRRMGRDANGHESYTQGVLRLLDHYGPFRLAYLEALLRAADGRASKAVANAARQGPEKQA